MLIALAILGGVIAVVALGRYSIVIIMLPIAVDAARQIDANPSRSSGACSGGA